MPVTTVGQVKAPVPTYFKSCSVFLLSSFVVVLQVLGSFEIGTCVAQAGFLLVICLNS